MALVAPPGPMPGEHVNPAGRCPLQAGGVEHVVASQDDGAASDLSRDALMDRIPRSQVGQRPSCALSHAARDAGEPLLTPDELW